MGDDDDADAVFAQLAQNGEKAFHLVGIKACRRFVENQDLAGKIDGAGNRDDLADRDGLGRKKRIDVDIEAISLKQSSGALAHGAAVNHAEEARLAAEKQVFRYREVLQKIDLLIDGADAKRLCSGDIIGGNLVAFEIDRAPVAAIDAGQDLDQCRFARAVFAKKRMNLALLKGEIDVFKGGYAEKGFADASGFEKSVWC
jgi:hypothetical protein